MFQEHVRIRNRKNLERNRKHLGALIVTDPMRSQGRQWRQVGFELLVTYVSQRPAQSG